MAATYDSARTRALDRVRSRIRDIGNHDVLLVGVQPISGAISSDENIIALIGSVGEDEAAAQLAEEHAAYYALEPSTIGQANGMSFSYGNRSAELQRIAASIRQQTNRNQSGRYSSSPASSVSNDVQW